MKIALLSTPWIAVPPKGYGGIELVVSNLANELVKRGHDVTLFATGDSTSKAQIKFYYPKALGNDLKLKQNSYNLLLHVDAFLQYVRNEKFDIVHSHVGQMAMFLFDSLKIPYLHTMHGAFYSLLTATSANIEQKIKTMIRFRHQPLVSISDNQRSGLPDLNYISTVYNGIDPIYFSYHPEHENYLCWIGRITKNKGLDAAIRVANKLNMKLKISGFIDRGDQEYFDEAIKPQIGKNIEMIGEILRVTDKNAFLGKAKACLFPIVWDEPFGLVMVEAMASGTPVIAFDKGSVPEVIEDGRSGFIVKSEDQMIDAVKKIDSLDRRYCHDYAVNKFNIENMVDGYINAYKQVMATQK